VSRLRRGGRPLFSPRGRMAAPRYRKSLTIKGVEHLAGAARGRFSIPSARGWPRAGASGRLCHGLGATAEVLANELGEFNAVIDCDLQRFGCEQRQLRSNFLAARLTETENHARKAGTPGNAGISAFARPMLCCRQNGQN